MLRRIELKRWEQDKIIETADGAFVIDLVFHGIQQQNKQYDRNSQNQNLDQKLNAMCNVSLFL